MKAEIKITLLGSFAVGLGHDQTAQFESDAARLLLAYLVRHPGTAFRREILADFFWPDSPREEALHALRQTLTRLRRAIRDEDRPTPFLEITRQTIAFVPRPGLWVDLLQFTEAAQSVHRHEHKRLERCLPCVRALEEAVGLFRGEFLEGLHFDSGLVEDWIVVQREQVHQTAAQAYTLLARRAECLGEYEQARRYARRQLDLEPWREEAHRQLIRALARGGDRGAALKQYELCKSALAAELGVEPEAETQALAEQIRANRFSAENAAFAARLPVYFTPFIGRARELEHILSQLNHPGCRLLTLQGPGGMGKTRLAVQTAAQWAPSFRDGAAFVPLETLDSAELLLPAIAQALRIDAPSAITLTHLQERLRGRECLLVLDGFEKWVRQAGLLGQLLQAAPGLTLLVTSRERLNLAGEWVLPVEGLSFAAPVGEPAGEQEAVQLFKTCARRGQPSFQPSPLEEQAIAELCASVEGMPLAIELAAGWVAVYSCREIAAEIRRDLNFLSGEIQGVPADHRSLRAVFDASWSILSPAEQSALARLTVFPGSFDRAAAQAAGVSPTLLMALVNRSLLRQHTLVTDSGDVQRCEFQDLIRRFVVEIAAPNSPAELAAFSAYYLQMLLEHAPQVWSDRQPNIFALLDMESVNLQHAWKWTLAHPIPELRQAGMVLFTFLDQRSRHLEGLECFQLTAEVQANPRLRAFFSACRGWFLFLNGRQSEGREHLQLSLAVAREARLPHEELFALVCTGGALFKLGEYPEARQHALAAFELGQALHDLDQTVTAAALLGQVAYAMGDFQQAGEWCAEAIAGARVAGGRSAMVAGSLRQLGNIAYSQNRYPAARDYYEQALARYQIIGNRAGESAIVNNLASIAIRLGDYTLGREYLERALILKQAIGDPWGIVIALSNLGVLADDEGDFETARDTYTRALELGRQLDSQDRVGRLYHNLGSTYIHLGQFEEAEERLQQALAIRQEINDREGVCRTLDTLGLIQIYRNEPQAAIRLATRSLNMAREIGNRALQAYALLDLGQARLLTADAAGALADFTSALELRREMGETHLSIEMAAHVAHTLCLLGRQPEALAGIQEVLAYLEQNRLVGAEDAIQVYLHAHRVLAAAGHPRAAALLDEAHTLLLNQATRLKTEALRNSLLLRIPSHRAVLEAWAALHTTHDAR